MVIVIQTKAPHAEGIHLRVFFSGGKKKNTCAPRSMARLLRAKAGIEKHIARNPKDAAARSRLSNLASQIMMLS